MSHARAWELKKQWGVRFEHEGDPAMNNPSGITTHVQVFKNEHEARAFLTRKLPRNMTYRRYMHRRIVHRFVTDWIEQEAPEEE